MSWLCVLGEPPRAAHGAPGVFLLVRLDMPEGGTLGAPWRSEVALPMQGHLAVGEKPHRAVVKGHKTAFPGLTALERGSGSCWADQAKTEGLRCQWENGVGTEEGHGAWKGEKRKGLGGGGLWGNPEFRRQAGRVGDEV